MIKLFPLFLLACLVGCASTSESGTQWTKEGASEEQIAKDLEHCTDTAAAVMKKSSKNLHKGGISTARSSIAQMDAQNEGFEDNPSNRKIVRAHCMEKKKYIKAPKGNNH